MGVSPVELIIHAKSKAFPQSLINKQQRGALPHFACDSNQVRAPLLPSPDRFLVISTLNRWRGVPVLSAGMPTQLEGAMHALMTVFYNYSGNDGDKHKLNKGELKQLLHSELNHFLTVKNHIAFNNCIYIVWFFLKEKKSGTFLCTSLPFLIM